MKYKCTDCGDVWDKCNILCPKCNTLINCHDIIKGVNEVENEK